eukprot:CAMPEP_0175064734 /NCGR_PEP_ID=MMETSP0052_2-20121109/15508_1 /TAXON_ID=51329 ORGANISM="Polytomella parva, Strain SAG 63-3" /NCGR_SAMPLE_ID=MMETSP0052_2 /ASSEMBLY_ACC=CAM_ASM_000194 /LENGTH=353 /DNA_ID=CAMNT_0016331139 /DNA_START=89 /DNA_END=1146 /DNA_ORIENTATION=+
MGGSSSSSPAVHKLAKQVSLGVAHPSIGTANGAFNNPSHHPQQRMDYKFSRRGFSGGGAGLMSAENQAEGYASSPLMPLSLSPPMAFNSNNNNSSSNTNTNTNIMTPNANNMNNVSNNNINGGMTGKMTQSMNHHLLNNAGNGNVYNGNNGNSGESKSMSFDRRRSNVGMETSSIGGVASGGESPHTLFSGSMGAGVGSQSRKSVGSNRDHRLGGGMSSPAITSHSAHNRIPSSSGIEPDEENDAFAAKMQGVESWLLSSGLVSADPDPKGNHDDHNDHNDHNDDEGNRQSNASPSHYHSQYNHPYNGSTHNGNNGNGYNGGANSGLQQRNSVSGNREFPPINTSFPAAYQNP